MSAQERVQYVLSLPIPEYEVIRKAAGVLKSTGMQPEAAWAKACESHRKAAASAAIKSK